MPQIVSLHRRRVGAHNVWTLVGCSPCANEAMGTCSRLRDIMLHMEKLLAAAVKCYVHYSQPLVQATIGYYAVDPAM